MSTYENHPEEHEHHIVPLFVYFAIFGTLMVLLVATVGASFMALSPGLSAIVALAIATTKAVLIILYFMHVKYSSKLVWAYAAAGFFGLLILLVILMADYVGRDGIESLTSTSTSFLISQFASEFGLG